MGAARRHQRHAKVDENTGELLVFNYGKEAPYMHYGVVDTYGVLVHFRPIPLPGPRLPHDMAFTERYAILNDLPLFWDPGLLARGAHVPKFFPDILQPGDRRDQRRRRSGWSAARTAVARIATRTT